MPRSTLPHALAILQLTFRTFTLLASHGCLITSIYITFSFSSSNPLLYISLLWFIILDNLEILALTNTGTKRPSLCTLIILEALGFALFAIAFFLTFMGRFGEKMGGVPDDLGEDGLAESYMRAQWSLVFVIVGLEFFMMLVCILDGWAHMHSQPGRVRRRIRNPWGESTFIVER